MDKAAGDAVQLQFQVGRAFGIFGGFEQIENSVVLIAQRVERRQFVGAGDEGALQLRTFDRDSPLDVTFDAHGNLARTTVRGSTALPRSKSWTQLSESCQ